jgi:hypothetical protein
VEDEQYPMIHTISLKRERERKKKKKYGIQAILPHGSMPKWTKKIKGRRTIQLYGPNKK